MEPIHQELDNNLSSLLKQGEKSAFATLFKNYSQKLYRFSYSYLRCREDAEEVVQEVFFKVWEKRNELRPDLSLNHFLFTIAYNITLNILRKRKNGIKAMAVHLEKMPSSHLHVEEELWDSEFQQRAKVAIAALPPQRKRIYLLSREQHLSYKEIGEKLNISPKTVEVHISQALKDIRKHLLQLGISLSASLAAISFLLVS
jgi:RNA polymerase sigma-70 factor, ECF subfamily